MKAFATLLGLSLASALVGQNTLTTVPALTGLNTQGIPGTMFFNLTAVNSLTLTRIDLNSASVAGTAGQIRLWRTIPGFAFSGSETDRSRWQLLAQGDVIAAGVGVATTFCLETPVALSPADGTRGFAVEYLKIQPAYTTGNGTNQTASDANLQFAAGVTQQNANYYDFDQVEESGTNFMNAVVSPRVFNGSFHYSLGAALPCSYSHKRFPGCGAAVGSWFQKLYTPGHANSVLPARQVIMSPDGLGGYIVVNNPAGALIPTTGHTAVNLSLGVPLTGSTALDDGENTLPLTFSFPASGGAVNQLFANTNGVISTTSLQTFLTGSGGVDWAPRLSDLLNGPTAWYTWHDFDFTLAGSMFFLDNGSQAIITYQGVPSQGGLATDVSTFQYVFDVSGTVTMYWDSITPVSLGYYSGDPYMVGYSHGGTSIRPAETDLLNPAPNVWGAWSLGNGVAELGNLTLSAAPRPLFGSVINYSVANVPVGGFGQLFFSLTNPFAPGFALSGVGFTMPNCMLNFDLFAYGATSAFNDTIANAGPVFSLDTVPAALLGVQFWIQAAAVGDLGNINGTLISSNALHQRVEAL